MRLLIGKKGNREETPIYNLYFQAIHFWEYKLDFSCYARDPNFIFESLWFEFLVIPSGPPLPPDMLKFTNWWHFDTTFKNKYLQFQSIHK